MSVTWGNRLRVRFHTVGSLVFEVFGNIFFGCYIIGRTSLLHSTTRILAAVPPCGSRISDWIGRNFPKSHCRAEGAFRVPAQTTEVGFWSVLDIYLPEVDRYSLSDRSRVRPAEFGSGVKFTCLHTL